METAAFKKAYQNLNDSQRQAVDIIEGPVLVVAGPGTGKTQVLATRIANILRTTDTAPENILALTFTESAAKNMRERVVSLIGKTGYYVTIATFHAFCTAIITRYPEYFPIDPDSKPISDVERFKTLQSCIAELPLTVLRPLNAPNFYLRDIARALSELKREGITPDAFAEKLEVLFAAEQEPEKKGALLQFHKQAAKNRELVQLYSLYQQKLLEQQRYDFDDMITYVIGAFATESELLLAVQEQYQFFLVDEYQDTNTAQNIILTQLASYWQEKPNIFAVGDPHQSIYRFQGASTENVLSFVERYPQAHVITLDTSYRCPAQITAVAQQLIATNTLTHLGSSELSAYSTLRAALEQPLKTVHTFPNALGIYAAPTQTLELMHVADEITKLLKNGVDPAEIAVLYRTNKEAVELGEVLDKWGVIYEREGGTSIFEYEPVRQLLRLLRVVEAFKHGAEDAEFFEVLCTPWIGLEVLSVYRLAHQAGMERKEITKLCAEGYATLVARDPDCLTQEQYENVCKSIENLRHWAALDAELPLPQWFETVLTESGFLPWAKQQPLFTELLQFTTTLFEYIQQLSRTNPDAHLTELLETIETMQSYGVPLIVQNVALASSAVHVSTVHKAKGREWEYVFILHCQDGIWGNTRERSVLKLPEGLLKHSDISKKEKNEDDRRLLYVALTRAKKRCILWYPETVVTQSRTSEVVPSMFIHELLEADSTLQVERMEESPSQQQAYLERLIAPRPAQPIDLRTRSFFEQAVRDYRLSVSSLNQYLRDPATFILTDLLRIPRAKAPYLSFGTAMHAALEVLFRQVLQGVPVELERVEQRFATVLRAETLTAEDYERRLAYGRTVLQEYLAALDLTGARPWLLEQRFGDGVRQSMLEDIPLVGRIDRFDWLDEAKKQVRVIDYKTGAIKTRGTLEGKTLAAELSAREQALPDGLKSPFMRQLLFYKLISELDHTFQPTVVEGVFEFVTPDKKSGKFVQHAFTLSQEDVAALKELIRAVMAEIRSLAFLEHLPHAIATEEVQSTLDQQML